MGQAQPNLFTIPFGISFARALAEGVIRRCGGDPLVLADALVLVPTRRAARSLRDVFAASLGGAALLPRIQALGDIDEDETIGAAADGLVAPAIAPLRRRLLLAALVQRWGAGREHPPSFAQAMIYAEELGRFLDEAITQQRDVSKLKALVLDGHAAHWGEVLKFLSIIVEHWPQQLKCENAIEPAERREQQLRGLGAALAANVPRVPVIAAGSTGSIPATAELLKTIAHLPSGAVVLPGLDTGLDDRSWEALEPGHAQFGLRELLAYIGADRADVRPWSPLPESYEARVVRVRFLSEALRPPPTTDSWRDMVEKGASKFAGALENLALVEASTPREEALVIAIALREALETAERTAALVTPDRGLARRVAAELTRWNIAIDDSAGSPLSRTPPGAFLALLARAAAQGFPPVALLALLKHPLAAGGESAPNFRRHVRRLEYGYLRGLRPAPGLEGIAAKLAREATAELRQWFARLLQILTPLSAAIEAKNPPLSDLARAHATAAELLAATDSERGAAVLWRGPAGEAAAHLIAELMQDSEGIALEDGGGYTELFRELAEARAVRPPYNRHRRLAILGPLEARLQDFDLVILGGLNEGTWPAEASTDPWLSRPMRESLGLEPPERRTGLAAHDFATLAAMRTVLMTRSLKESGAPTNASRWVLRIKQLAKGLQLDSRLQARDDLLVLARRIDVSPREKRARCPSPRPPVEVRPRQLRVTEIETWLRDPYAIYARRILKLRPLDPIDSEPGPAERGTAIHHALERFLRTHPQDLPPDALERLLRIGDDTFAEAGASAAVLALWRPRFERAARWFLAYEEDRRSRIERSVVEAGGKIDIPARPKFRLTCRADRIDWFADGSAAILDYKTGRVPSDKQVEQLVAPQLPLEAAMLMMGGFDEPKTGIIRELVHVRLTGGEPPGKDSVFDGDATLKAMEALARLTKLIARYDEPTQAYRSREMPFRITDVGDYDHLARVREWSRGEDEE